MIGILVQLALSWLIAFLFARKNLSVLGLRPTAARLTDLMLFFALTAGFCALANLVRLHFTGEQLQLNPKFSFQLLLDGIWWNIKSVMFEELIFRGVILYLLIRKIGAMPAILISAIGFGIYHWFSFSVIGNPMQMLIVFLTTGCMGFVLATGYRKTFSMYIPIAVHLGWNFTHIFIFLQGPTGNGMFVTTAQHHFRTDSYFTFFLVIFGPLLLMLLVNYLLIVRKNNLEVV
ncbi:MAG: CPBP family intramembrane metalloprotease [Pedobacter sp.]|nr:MAG: CPBP family intramembrane metalloprotease [Pedobacter sp.]